MRKKGGKKKKKEENLPPTIWEWIETNGYQEK